MSLGVPRSGKTAHAKILAMQWARAGSWVFISDPAEQYRDVSHPVGSPTELSKMLHSGQQIPRILAVTSKDSDGVRDCVMQWAQEIKASNPRIYLVFDESVLLKPRFLKPQDLELIVKRRHYRIGPHYIAQDPSMLDPILLRQSTDLYLFRLPDLKRAALVEQRTSFTGIAERLPTLERCQFIHCSHSL